MNGAMLSHKSSIFTLGPVWGDSDTMLYPQKNHLSLQNELPNLDLLRATAVLLVLVDHVLETIGHKANLSFHPYNWYLGRLGVLIFFVHTSLVLMWSMQRLRLQGGALLRSFYIRRAFRIYPLSMLSVVAVLLFGIPTDRKSVV